MKTWQIILLFALLAATAAGVGYLIIKKPADHEPEPEGLEPVKAPTAATKPATATK